MVYVDPLRFYGGANFFRNKRTCHMWADTLDELHEMAHNVGMRREWFQGDPRLPHYDLVAKRRKKAVELGAVEVTHADLVAVMRKRRHQEFLGSIKCPQTAKREHRG